MGNMVLAELKYPHMREELIGYLQSLADKDYQLSVWVRGESYPGVVHDELDYAIHFFYDDTCLSESPTEAIGWFLKDEAEANSICELIRCLDDLFAKYGRNLTDKQYIDKQEWSRVIEAANASKTLLMESS